MKDKRRSFSGLTELMILACLKKRPCYCYEIVKFINTYSSVNYEISQNTAYTSLYSLVDKKLVSEKSVTVGVKRKRVYYSITDTGIEYYSELFEEYNSRTKTVEQVINSTDDLGEEKNMHEILILNIEDNEIIKSIKSCELFIVTLGDINAENDYSNYDAFVVDFEKCKSCLPIQSQKEHFTIAYRKTWADVKEHPSINYGVDFCVTEDNIKHNNAFITELLKTYFKVADI